MRKNERFVGDGLFASYDGYAIYLRAPREDDDDHIVALEPQVLKTFIEWALTIDRPGKIIRRTVNQVRRRELETLPPVPNYDTTAERDMDRDGPGRDITDE